MTYKNWIRREKLKRVTSNTIWSGKWIPGSQIIVRTSSKRRMGERAHPHAPYDQIIN